MGRKVNRITRVEVRWRVFPVLLGVILLIAFIGRTVGPKVAEATTLGLLLVPTLWYLATSFRGNRNADTVSADVAWYPEMVDVPTPCDVGGDVGGCN